MSVEEKTMQTIKKQRNKEIWIKKVFFIQNFFLFSWNIKKMQDDDGKFSSDAIGRDEKAREGVINNGLIIVNDWLVENNKKKRDQEVGRIMQ